MNVIGKRSILLHPIGRWSEDGASIGPAISQTQSCGQISHDAKIWWLKLVQLLRPSQVVALVEHNTAKLIADGHLEDEL